MTMDNKASDLRRGGRGTVTSRKRRRRLQPTLLALETRTLLSTFPVTNNAVDDVNTTGTLRWAIAQANAATSASAIEFELGSTPATITLTQGQLELINTTDATTIYDGPGEGAVTVSGNNASRVFRVDSGVTASISGLTITGGSSSGNGGGLVSYGTTTLTNCTVSGNSAHTGGGLWNSGTTTLTDCTVSGNSVASGRGGGGLYNHGGTLTLTNCTVSGNLGHSRAAGVATSNGILTLTNCTVSGNSGTGVEGLAAYGSSTTTLNNTIVAGNSGGGFADVSGKMSGSNNLIGSGYPSGIINGVDGNIVGVTNPLLAPLGNYGGPTQTMAELPGSPAIDAGSNALIPTGVTTDQRSTGYPRILNSTVDIGAFESSGFTIAVTSGSGQTAGAVFPELLVATVTANDKMEPVAGGLVTFAAPPLSGPSALISGSPALITASGTASVTAANDGFAGSYIVSATAIGAPVAAPFSLTNLPLVSIAVSPGNPELALGVTGQFTTTANFSDGSTADFTDLVTWVSATPSVAAIGATGLASPVAVGQSVITASLAGVTSPHGTLTVIAPRFVVNTTADDFGFYSGTTSLREAIASANLVPGQTITFDKKVFKTQQTINFTLGQLELSDTTGTTTIMGPAAGVTVNSGGASRVFQIDSGVTASISGMTITGGHANYNGGGLFNDGGNLTLTHCTVSGNTSGDPHFFPYYGGGGGLCNYGTSDLSNCIISDNTAYGAFGGGVENGGRYSASVTLSNCTVSGNTAGEDGGGLSNRIGSSAKLTGCNFSGNYADGGGGLVNLYGTLTLTGSTVSGNTAGQDGGGLASYGGTATLTNCTVSNNSATAGSFGNGGGGVCNFSGVVTLTGCKVSGNTDGWAGGGLFNTSFYQGLPGQMTLTNCTVSGNSAVQGGGVYSGQEGFLTGYVNSTLTLIKCSVSGNHASYGGGVAQHYGTVKVLNSTISGNSANGGGGLLNAGTATLVNCTVSGNTAVAGGGIYNIGALDVSFTTIKQNGATGVAAGDGIGGGILSNGGSVTIGNLSALISNTAIGGAGGSGVAGGDGLGGGLALENNATATVSNTSFLGNLAQGGAGGTGAGGGNGIGGGIAVGIGGSSDASSVSLTNGLLSLNLAQGGKGAKGANGGNGEGGGMFVGAAGSATLDQFDVLLNLALAGLAGTGGTSGEGLGGGLYVTSGGVVTLDKTTVVLNIASTSNGNIYGTVTYE
jgi:fibronectin-binding autotransporter adhesin